MENFVFSNRTKIIFGRGTEQQVGVETAALAKKSCFTMAAVTLCAQA